MSSSCVVVGGGLTGLFASVVASERFDRVHVVEREDSCGGLLRSVQDERGIWYDQGTHVPDTTRVPVIDEILFGTEEELSTHWAALGPLQTGNYFGGRWNDENATVDGRVLPSQLYDKAINELLARTELSKAKDIASYLVETIGPTFTKEVIAPVAAKLYGAVDPATLATETSVSYFGLHRIIALNPVVTHKLKELEAFDSKLGYHTNTEHAERLIADGVPPRENYYPRNGRGVSFWVDRIVDVAKERGVRFHLGCEVEALDSSGKAVTRVKLSDGRVLDSSCVVWTIPPQIALKAAGLPLPSVPVELRTTRIFHYSLDRPLDTRDAHYLWCWDPEFQVFRITLYDNLKPDQESTHSVTAEVLSRPEDASAVRAERVLEELTAMEIVPAGASVLSATEQTLHNTFPVPTIEYTDGMKQVRGELDTRFDNLLVCGRHGGKAWFHKDVAQEVFELLEGVPVTSGIGG